MRSNTAGAPTLPIKTEDDLYIDALARRLARERNIPLEQAMPLAQDFLLQKKEADARHAKMEADYNAATGLPGPPPDMSEFDSLPGDEPGTVRRWNPGTGRYDTVQSPRPRPAVTSPPGGRPWGGGQPFATQAEQDEYYARSTLSEKERQQLLAAGKSPEEIADMQSSQWDRDARNAGMGSHGGYAPVFVNGRVMMMPRAPTPDKQPGQVEQSFGSADPVEPASQDMSATLGFARDLMDAGVADQLPVPLGDDGLPLAARVLPGTANAATGNAAAGPRAENRDVPPGLRRPDLESRGYQPVFMQGPNGGEWVYARPQSAVDLAREAHQQRERARLSAMAGYDADPGEDQVSTLRLRMLINEKRKQEKAAKDLLWRPRTMAQAGNAIGAAALPGINDWQLQMLAGGPTPLAVEAVGAQNAMRMMNAEALAGMEPFRQRMATEQRESQYDQLPADQQVAVSRRRGEPMGTGRSAAHVNARWNYWMSDWWGWDAPGSVRRETGFRREMEALGYKPAEIDRFIDERRKDGSPSASSAPASPPGAPPIDPWMRGGDL